MLADVNKEDIQAKNELIYILARQGYEPYSKLLNRFYVHLVDDGRTIGAMIPDEYIILISRNLTKKQASFVVRHEILHQYLDHALRSVEHLGQEIYDGRSSSMHQRLNIAQDYEISDLGATEDDYEIIRGLHALLLCDDHPEWVGMSFEEIYDLLSNEEDDQDGEQEQNNNGNQDLDPEFIEGWNDLCDGLKNHSIDPSAFMED